MIPELGHFALILAFCLALVQGIVPIVGARLGIREWTAVAIPAARGQFLFVALAFLALAWAFVSNDFSVAYVADNSNTALPLGYRIAAVWGAHEGSLLLWSLILAGWTFLVTRFSRGLPDTFVAQVVAVLGLVSVGFLLFMLTTSNPFTRLVPAPENGADLNPLLQDPGLAMHPPVLYMGYVGMAVPFAFAIAALLDGHIDAAWTRWTRPWTVVAWVFLTLGITFGSWWSYKELGWGGWWFWDPVENASFMPWLVATALIHSLAVTEKRAAFKAWTLLLAIFAFSLSLLGTFLVRSGVLVSVHAFATDPARGVFILAFLAVVVGAALTLYAWRATTVSGGGNFQLLSRETLLLINNVLLVVAAGTVLLGTLYPLILDALHLGKISVGPPYFNSVFVPLMLPLLLVLGIGPITRWKHDEPRALLRRVRAALVVTLALGVALLVFAFLGSTLAVAAALALAAWVVCTAVQSLRQRLAHKQNLWQGLRRLPRGFIGMTLAHFGVAIFVVGVTLASGHSLEKDVRLSPGETYHFAGYRLVFDGVGEVHGPNYRAQQGVLHVFRNGREVTTLRPQKRVYVGNGQPTTEAAIDPGLVRDIYVSLGDPLGGGAWSMRLYYKSFVRWIWFGAMLMAAGGVIAVSDRRYRLALRARAPARRERDGAAPEGEPALEGGSRR